VLPFLAAPLHGQSLGDIARQERARKQAQPQQTTHVYTNDDLTRDQILLPADRDRIEAPAQTAQPAQAVAPPPAAPTAPSEADTNLTPNVDPNTLPLGDIARHYRALKAARQQQQQSQTAAKVAAPSAPSLVNPAPPQSPAHPDRPSRPVAPPAPTEADVYLDPNVDPNTLPLGDIARHYRALKAAQQRAEAQAAASQPLPSATPLADPTFTEPPATSVQPALPLRAATSSARPVERVRRTVSREKENIAGAIRFRVRSGDTLWNLARKYLGRGKDWLALAARNPQVSDPRRLQAGTWLRLLPDATRVRDSAAAERVRVERGESLWKLSQLHFGSGTDWICIAQANPELRDANLIFPGQVVTVPATCDAAQLPRVRGPLISADASAGPDPVESHQPR
jgi:nucleoid-associated protein YgaU